MDDGEVVIVGEESPSHAFEVWGFELAIYQPASVFGEYFRKMYQCEFTRTGNQRKHTFSKKGVPDANPI